MAASFEAVNARETRKTDNCASAHLPLATTLGVEVAKAPEIEGHLLTGFHMKTQRTWPSTSCQPNGARIFRSVTPH